jgi:hypothetical protein
MAMKDVQRAYKQGGLKGVWRYVTNGAYTRWRAARNWSARKIRVTRRRFRAARDRFQHFNSAIKSHKEKRDRLQSQQKQLNRALDRATSEERRQEVRKRLDNVVKEKDQVLREIKELRKDRNRTFDRKRHLADRATAWVRAHIVYRSRWRKAKKRHQEQQQQGGGGSSQPTFEPWMANGRNWQDANQWSRDFVARAVVIDGNYCTSMARTFVPPGGSTTSWHLVWNGGKAADVGPMAATQSREFNRGKGNAKYFELFGPNNYQWLKYGSVISGTEGSGLEQLHDTHTHGAGEY